MRPLTPYGLSPDRPHLATARAIEIVPIVSSSGPGAKIVPGWYRSDAGQRAGVTVTVTDDAPGTGSTVSVWPRADTTCPPVTCTA